MASNGTHDGLSAMYYNNLGTYYNFSSTNFKPKTKLFIESLLLVIITPRLVMTFYSEVLSLHGCCLEIEIFHLSNVCTLVQYTVLSNSDRYKFEFPFFSALTHFNMGKYNVGSFYMQKALHENDVAVQAATKQHYINLATVAGRHHQQIAPGKPLNVLTINRR